MAATSRHFGARTPKNSSEPFSFYFGLRTELVAKELRELAAKIEGGTQVSLHTVRLETSSELDDWTKTTLTIVFSEKE